MKNWLRIFLESRQDSETINGSERRFNSVKHKKMMDFFDFLRTPEGEKLLKKAFTTGVSLEITKKTPSTGL